MPTSGERNNGLKEKNNSNIIYIYKKHIEESAGYREIRVMWKCSGQRIYRHTLIFCFESSPSLSFHISCPGKWTKNTKFQFLEVQKIFEQQHIYQLWIVNTENGPPSPVACALSKTTNNLKMQRKRWIFGLDVQNLNYFSKCNLLSRN